MITKDHLLASMKRDCEIAKHLFEKVKPESFDYRPTPKQRSTTELLQYLSICGIGGATCMVEDNWKLFGEFSERSAQMAPEGFPAAMDQQIADLKKLFDSLSDEDMVQREAPVPGGGRLPLGVAIFAGPGKWLTAYKMQLFLYAKAAGALEIGTINAWAGMDPPE